MGWAGVAAATLRTIKVIHIILLISLALVTWWGVLVTLQARHIATILQIVPRL